jgi:chromate reductase, NAD(P)H dehydrogenase (quinone)
MTTKIIAFAGSVRKGSINRDVLSLAVDGASAAGASVTTIDLKEFSAPLYDADWHRANGVPDTIRALRESMRDAGGLLIASPEYNTSLTPLLKNTIDWLSQSVDSGIGAGSGRMPFENKVIGLMGASAGGFGTIRALPHVSFILSNLGSVVLPVLAVPHADKLRNADGSVANERAEKSLNALGAQVARLAGALKAS